MNVIFGTAMVSGSPTFWRMPPSCEIIVLPECSKITEVRWRLEFEDPKHPVQKVGRGRLVRTGSGGVNFENEPAAIRCAYRVVDESGEARIEGDIALWNELESYVDYY